MARVTFEGKRYPLAGDETVLDALLRGGADIPFSCRKGTCQSCMLRADAGDPGEAACSGLRASLRTEGYFLPCRSRPAGDLLVSRPDPSSLYVRAHVHDKERLAPGIVRVRLETETTFAWRPGQYVNVRGPGGEIRSYSLSSLPEEDYYLELHVERHEHGAVSRWLTDEVAIGDVLDIQGPLGECCYEPGREDRPLLLLGTGTGLSPLVGVARDALARGHRGEIFLYHGASDPERLYLRERLEALAAAHVSFHYVPCASGGDARPGMTRGRALEVALARHPSLEGFTVYLAGSSEVVHAARYRAFRAGALREETHADPFDDAERVMPDDAAKLASLAPDPELWKALGEGVLLRTILTEFYGRVYEDPRLEPFFHKVTKERAIDKQYAFLADVFTGKKDYFGLKPFNAHHWMIISDELFDYRERLIEDVMRRHGLSEAMIRRWGAVHELFRREIVKSRARGLVIDGVEHRHEGFREETVEVACLCDGCEGEIAEGSVARLHARTGELFCAACSARKVGATLQPPAA